MILRFCLPLLALAALLWWRAEPTGQEWMQRLRADADALERTLAACALSRVPARQVDAAAEALLDAAGDRAQQVRAAARGSLARLGRAAAPALVQALDEAQATPRGTAASDALAGLGPAVLSPLIQALLAPRHRGREAVADTLGRLGPEALEPLARLLEHEQKHVRSLAARALAGLGPLAAPAVPELVRALEDAWAPAGFQAARALAAIRPGDDASLRLLVPAALAAPPALRRKAVAAAVGGLLDGMGREDEAARRAAAGWLAVLGEHALGPLVAALRDEDEARARLAAGCLGALGPAAVRAMVQTIHERRWDLMPLLGQVARDAGPEALPVLIGFLDGPDRSHRMRAALVLAELGPTASAAVPGLLALMQDEDAGARSVAVLALARVGLEDDGVVERLLRSADRDDLFVRAIVPLLLPGLLRRAAAGPPEARERARDLIADLGLDALPALLEALEEEQEKAGDGGRRAEAARALERLGPGAAAALPRLDALGKDPDEALRAAAHRAARSIRDT